MADVLQTKLTTNLQELEVSSGITNSVNSEFLAAEGKSIVVFKNGIN